jgi:hypothetical protein
MERRGIMAWSMYREVEDLNDYLQLMRDLESLGFKRVDKPNDYFRDFLDEKKGIIVNSNHTINIVFVSKRLEHLFREKYLEYDSKETRYEI